MAPSRLTIATVSVLACLILAIGAFYRSSWSRSAYRSAYLDKMLSSSAGYGSEVPTFVRDMVKRPLPEGTPRNSTTAMYRRLVVFTAFSSNHLLEALDMIGSVQKYLPYTKIIVYDIGLSSWERAKVAKFCNVELRKFDFTKYPPHVRNIKNYAWRPFMLQELVQEYDVILYGDASLRMIGFDISKALESLLDFPFLDVLPDYRTIISLTHEKQIEYFNFPPSRQYMAKWKCVQATAWFLLVNDIAKEKIIDPWVDCVAHESCVAPKGATKGNCNYKLLQREDGSFIGCHRFIQSALNIILVKNFGLQIWDKVVRYDVMGPIATIHRHAQELYPVQTHPFCDT